MAFVPGIKSPRFSRPAVAAAMGLCLLGSTALARDDDDMTDDPPMRRPIVVAGVPPDVLPELSNIENFVLEKRSGEGDPPPASFDDELETKVDEMSLAARLSEIQKRKLLLAGRGDIKRFRDRVDAIKARYKSGNPDERTAGEISKQLQQMRADYCDGLFAGQSLFAKTSATILTPAQTLRLRDIPTLRYRRGVETAVGMWSIFLELRAEQRTRLATLLLNNSRPPRVFAVQTKRAFHDLVLVQLSRIPAKDLKPVFDADQWRTLQNCFQLAPRARQSLVRQGTTFEWDDDPGSAVLR
jgi:hypothetical protein